MAENFTKIKQMKYLSSSASVTTTSICACLRLLGCPPHYKTALFYLKGLPKYSVELYQYELNNAENPCKSVFPALLAAPLGGIEPSTSP